MVHFTIFVDKNFSMKKLLTCCLLLSVSLIASAENWVEVCGEGKYEFSENITPQEAKSEALKRAKANALEERFGVMVSQEVFSQTKELNGKTDDYISVLSGSELRGEWIEDTREPEYQLLQEQGVWVYKVSVCGKARERQTADFGLIAKVLRRADDERSESADFQSGDAFYLYFRTPIKGFVSVYLADENQNVSCLLPYQRQPVHSVEVKADTDYLFFSEKQDNRPFVDEYVLTADEGIVQNRIYIVFSPNDFVKVADKERSKDALRELSFADFQAWLSKNRGHDTQMQVVEKTLTIRK